MLSSILVQSSAAQQRHKQSLQVLMLSSDFVLKLYILFTLNTTLNNYSTCLFGLVLFELLAQLVFMEQEQPSDSESKELIQ